MSLVMFLSVVGRRKSWLMKTKILTVRNRRKRAKWITQYQNWTTILRRVFLPCELIEQGFFTTFKCLRLKLMVTVQWWKVVSWTFCKITYSKRNGNLFYSIGTSLKMYLARVLWTNWKTNGYQSDWEKAQKQSLHLFEATYCRY